MIAVCKQRKREKVMEDKRKLESKIDGENIDGGPECN